MTRPELETLFRRYEEAWRRHDLEALSSLYAADAVADSPTAGRSVTGRDAIIEISRTWFTGFPDVDFKTNDLIVDGDRVVGIVTASGTDTGGFLGLPPTNKPFRVPVVVILAVRDGQIWREQRIYDFTGLLLQIGVLKAKPA
jgi:steroid delta-isomerase-like uncharacterized protein